MSSDAKARLAALGLRVPELLLPREDVDLSRFAVIACDQFSAEKDYWERVRALVGDAPSALHMILPEAWLRDGEAHRAAIVPTMERYLEDGVLRSVGEGMVFLKRETASGVRRGLVVAFDLEQYDFREGSHTLLRPTEATVESRLPARVEIRREAPLELPHVLVLFNDPTDALMDAMEGLTAQRSPLYDFELMERGGHLTGWRVNEELDYVNLLGQLERLLDEANHGMLYAMGDGNHSFAAAKLHWEQIKATLPEEQWEGHPARYALCELVNLYDKALPFEPIHRLVMGADGATLCRELGLDPASPPPLQELQPRLDEWLQRHPEAELEYIHGADKCRELGEAPDSLAIVWESFDREGLFPWVAAHGPLCRKSFSLGHAEEKRYYLEARRIR